MVTIDEALQPMKDMLAADDFHLAVADGPDRSVVLTVSSGPDSCEECLVPKDTLESIARHYLAEAGVAPDAEVRIAYPGDPDPGC